MVDHAQKGSKSAKEEVQIKFASCCDPLETGKGRVWLLAARTLVILLPHSRDHLANQRPKPNCELINCGLDYIGLFLFLVKAWLVIT